MNSRSIRRSTALHTIVLLSIVSVAACRGDQDQIGAQADPHAGHAHGQASQAETRWTCSMHPQVNLPGPGQCPICGMDLIPVASGGAADDVDSERRLEMSNAAVKLADIVTVTVQRKLPRLEIPMVGQIDYDETRLSYITAYFPGRLERLYVDYTGVSVRAGEHLAEIYSPQLLSAQEELIQAHRTRRAMRDSSSSILRGSGADNVAAVRDKLRLWGLTDEQIRDIERKGRGNERMTIYSPASGVVIHKNAVEGMYVETGTRIYTVADLTKIWVRFDAYESDLPFLRYGQEVVFTAQAHPGEKFRGQIAFIDPMIDPRTRTVKVRVNVDNSAGRLKPGMFVRGSVRTLLSEDGPVVNAELAGKWVSRMHPEIVKDQAGECDVCGMDLERAEDLGLVKPGDGARAPLVIPSSAPLVTGKRAVVYVRVPGTERPTFEGREVELGPLAGNLYVVKSGLWEGEQVVVSGAFKIDSAMQIAAKRSMMQPEGDRAPAGHDHGGAAPSAGPAADSPALEHEDSRSSPTKTDEGNHEGSHGMHEGSHSN